MEIRVLDDLTIDGGRLSPKERSLLAALVLRAGNVVTPPELADAVWGDEPPGTWPKQVQAFVVRIRRALGSTSIAHDTWSSYLGDLGAYRSTCGFGTAEAEAAR